MPTLLRRRPLASRLLDLVFVAWLAYFLVTGSPLPAFLFSADPPVQATSHEELVPSLAPLDDDQAQALEGPTRAV